MNWRFDDFRSRQARGQRGREWQQEPEKSSARWHHLQPDLPRQKARANTSGLRVLERPVLPDGGRIRQHRPQAAERGIVGLVRSKERFADSYQLRHDGGREGRRGQNQNCESGQGKEVHLSVRLVMFLLGPTVKEFFGNFCFKINT